MLGIGKDSNMDIMMLFGFRVFGVKAEGSRRVSRGLGFRGYSMQPSNKAQRSTRSCHLDRLKE